MKSFAWAEAWLILSSIKKPVFGGGVVEAVWGGRVRQQVSPHLSQPHPFYLKHKPPPPQHL